MIMNDILQIVLAVIASSSVTSLALLRPKRRTGDTESYSLLLDDLNKRLDAYVHENAELRQKNNQLQQEIDQLRREVETIRTQLARQ